jgi:hypothetical protein
MEKVTKERGEFFIIKNIKYKTCLQTIKRGFLQKAK